jgi:tape measure domain-containing protein
MIQEEIARLTGTLKFNVDARPLAAFEKKLAGVTTMLQQFGAAANKKFNIKVSLDSRTLRAQMEKAVNTKIVFKNFQASDTALLEVSKKICEKLDKTPIRLSNIKVDVADLIAQKRFMRTLLGQMQVKLPVTISMKEAEKQLRDWKKGTESKYKLKIDADISQAKFIKNVKESLMAAKGKIGAMQIDLKDPKLKLHVDQAALRAQIRAAISEHQFTVRTRVSNTGGGGSRSRSVREGAIGGGVAGAGMGFMRGAIPGLGAAFAFSQLNQINQQMQAQQNAMTAVMGSEQAGQQQSAWVKSLSDTIGMDYRQVAPSYNKMLASGQTSGMSTESVQNIFKGVSEYGRTMGLDSESMKGSMRAIEQMMNKGQVMSEELKGQLAERMPGAMSAMAEAAGFGTDEKGVAKLMDAMKNGDVKSTAVLEKFSKILSERARAGGALDKAMESTAAQQARMNNAFSDLVASFSKAGFDAGMGRFFKAMADAMRDADPGIRSLGEAFNMLIEPVAAVINVVGVLIGLIPKIGALFGLTGAQVTALGVAFGLMMSPIGMVIGAIGVLGLALDDLIGFAEGKDSLFGRWLAESPEMQQAFNDLAASSKEFGTNIKAALDGAMELGGTLKGLSFPEMLTATMKELNALMETFNAAVTRFVKAGQYAQQTNSSGTAVEANARNILATVMGPEWVDAQLQEKYTAESAASLPPRGDVPQGNSFNSEELLNKLEELKQTFMVQDAMRLNPVEVKVDIKGSGIMTAGDISGALETEMVKIANKAFSGTISSAMTNTKETK